MTHSYLSDLREPDLKRETVDAKLRIEAMVGHSIEHFSCPGGRYDPLTLQMARQAGFVTVANSRFYANSVGTSPYELGRVAILRGLTLERFSTICHGGGLWKKRLQHRVRHTAQRLLGNAGYDHLRAIMLGKKQ
jgi:peptidoglycan/xylan/chitin deacetylase (PgdA/CDA1 family)